MTSDSIPECHNFLIVIDRSEFQRQSEIYLQNGASNKSYDNFIDHDDHLEILNNANLENQDSKQNSIVQRASSAASDRKGPSEKPSPARRKTKEKEPEKESEQQQQESRGYANRRNRNANRGKIALRTVNSRRSQNGIINTQVDTKLLVSVTEMAMRKKLKTVPENPMDLCQPLSIILNDLNLEDGDKPEALDEDQLQRLIHQITNKSTES